MTRLKDKSLSDSYIFRYLFAFKKIYEAGSLL